MAPPKGVETEVLVRYLDEAMRAVGADTPTHLARKARIAPSTLTRMLKEGGPEHQPRADTLRQIERVSRVPLPPELAAIARPEASGLPAHAVEGEVTVPVRALVGTRHDGLFLLNREPLEWTRRLPGLARRLRVFAVRMPDDSMTPWRQPNELVHIEPTWAVADGCHVLAYLRNTNDRDGDDLVCIRRFRGRDRAAGHVLLESYRILGETQRIPEKDVLLMQRVLEWPEVVAP